MTYKVSQTFTVPTEAGAWNRIAIEAITEKCYKPVEVKLEVYNSSGFTEPDLYTRIAFTTPIAETTLIVPPAMTSVWINIIMKVQDPGRYCWRLQTVNEDYMSKLIVHRRYPQLTTERAFEYNPTSGLEILDFLAGFVSKIHYASPKLERYLIREGAFDSTHQYVADAKTTNLWTIV